jgi:predicted amidohydrolase YtcJ
MTRTLLRGGRVYSPADPPATALLVEDGTIAWVGADPALGADAADRAVQLDGALVTPAFVDAHVHATSTGLALGGLDLSGAASLAEALDAVERHARRSGGRPVLGTGWDETRWPERRAPTRRELDRAGYGGLVYLARVDVHSAVVSSALLAAAPRLAGLAGFAESGHLVTEAHHAARRVAQESVTAGQRRDAQRATLQRAAALGIGCLHELAGPDISAADDLTDLLALAAAEPTPEVVPYWGELDGVATARELGAVGAAGDLFVDGAIGSHTACLSTPYADAPDTAGHAYLDAGAVRRHAVACTRAGLQAGFHAIGDAAVRAVVEGYLAAAEEVGVPAFAAARHRIEHLEMLGPDRHRLIAGLARLGVVASVQPAFDAFWGGPDGMYAARLGADRALAMNPFVDLATAGVPLAFGSDAPVTPLGPWEGVRAAMHHHAAAQRLPAAAAFEAHTAGGWLAARRNGGVLAPGAPATFAVWAAGDLGADGLPDLAAGAPAPACLRTVVCGQTIHPHGTSEMDG